MKASRCAACTIETRSAWLCALLATASVPGVLQLLATFCTRTCLQCARPCTEMLPVQDRSLVSPDCASCLLEPVRHRRRQWAAQPTIAWGASGATCCCLPWLRSKLPLRKEE